MSKHLEVKQVLNKDITNSSVSWVAYWKHKAKLLKSFQLLLHRFLVVKNYKILGENIDQFSCDFSTTSLQSSL